MILGCARLLQAAYADLQSHSTDSFDIVMATVYCLIDKVTYHSMKCTMYCLAT